MKKEYSERIRGRKITYQAYRMLDRSEKNLVKRVGGGQIVKRFDKTPYPKEDTDVVCPHFLELKWAYGCPGRCAWCYLQGTLNRLKTKTRPVIKDYGIIKSHLRAFVETKEPEILNAGEIGDSLMAENRKLPFSKFVLPLVEGTPHKVLFLSKFDYIDNLLEIEGQDNIITSFTLNARHASKRWEKNTHNPDRRLKAAKKLEKKGYEVRFRIDPVVPVSNWKRMYKGLIRDMKDIKVDRVTVGTLRGLRKTMNLATDKSWQVFLKDGEQTNFGKRMKFEDRLEIYDYIINELNSAGIEDVAVCKDTIGMWKELGLDYRKMKCNCIQ